jgi:hypothetical protein
MSLHITRIPTDACIQGLVVSRVGADLARTMAVLQQFGMDKKLGIITTTRKENYAGVYPDVVNGSIITDIHVSNPAPDNKWEQDYDTAFRVIATGKDAAFIGPLAGASNLTTGTVNSYTPYVTMTALKLALRSSSFTGKANTANLIEALESLDVKQGPDFPTGDVIMNKADHQGRTTIISAEGQWSKGRHPRDHTSGPTAAHRQLSGKIVSRLPTSSAVMAEWSAAAWSSAWIQRGHRVQKHQGPSKKYVQVR